MLNRCYIKLSLVNILEMFFVFIEILFKILLFKGDVLIYAEHCTYIHTDAYNIILFFCKLFQNVKLSYILES